MSNFGVDLNQQPCSVNLSVPFSLKVQVPFCLQNIFVFNIMLSLLQEPDLSSHSWFIFIQYLP